MSRQERHAWFNLGVLALAAALFALALPHIGAQRAIGYFGICGLWGLSPLFYRKGKKIMALDERESVQYNNGRLQLDILYSGSFLLRQSCFSGDGIKEELYRRMFSRYSYWEALL